MRDFNTELFKLLRQARLITPTERAAHPDTTILEHLKVAIIPSFVWPPEDPANLLAPFPSSSMNPSDPDGGPSGSYRHIKVNFTKGLPPFSPDHPTRRASGSSSVTQPSHSHDSVPQVTPPRPPKRRRPNPPDPAPAPASSVRPLPAPCTPKLRRPGALVRPCQPPAPQAIVELVCM